MPDYWNAAEVPSNGIPSRGAVQWYTRAGRLLSSFIEPNLDDFNTAIKGQLLGLLMEDDPTLRASWLKAYQNSQSNALATVMPGDGLGFKPDGTAFHHNGHYPAYATGAFSSLGFLFDHLRETPFQFSVPAQAAFRNALLTARIYSQKFDWPIGICGRHPFSGSISGQQRAFRALAAYPDPVTGITPDPEMSAALVRLWGNPGGELGEAINNAGIVPDYIDGFHSLPFANQAIARGPGWMVSMKGYSKYVWSSEIYSADNRYGRYQSNGSVEVLMENGRAASGFEQEGWDWNRLPGTTGIHLPLEELESPRSGSLLLRSNETFAGDANLNNRTGIFGFILNEPFFGNDLKARKSVCMLGDVLVALGSGINSSNTTYATETTIFQTALPSVNTPQYFGNGVGAKTGIDVSGSLPSGNGLWILDPVGTGYWLAPKQLLRWHRKTQDSFHNKTKQATSGDFSSVWIGHRTSPTNAKYHYAILPMATQEELEEFNQSMQSEETARYAVLSQTENLHAVYDNANSTLYVASFEAAENLNLPLLLATSEPMLVVVQEDGSGLNVAASNPDLKPTASGHTISTNNLLLTGHWMPAPSDACMYWHENGNTRVVLPTQAGETNEVSLVPATEILPFSDIPKSTEITPVTLVRTSPSTTEVSWVAEASPDRIGWIIEKLDSESGGYQPVVLLSSGARSWSDLQVGTNELVAYRITEWTTDSLGPPSLPVPIFQKEGFELTYDFREISSLDGFYSDGWIATDVTDAELYLDTLGLMLIDQSPTAPAAITLSI
jgi:chondroitin-sulfate-ABC endolyase/exolyase